MSKGTKRSWGLWDIHAQMNKKKSAEGGGSKKRGGGTGGKNLGEEG